MQYPPEVSYQTSPPLSKPSAKPGHLRDTVARNQAFNSDASGSLGRIGIAPAVPGFPPATGNETAAASSAAANTQEVFRHLGIMIAFQHGTGIVPLV